jgi:hypothetical protein
MQFLLAGCLGSQFSLVLPGHLPLPFGRGQKEGGQKEGGQKEGGQKEGGHKEGGQKEGGQEEGGHKEGARRGRRAPRPAATSLVAGPAQANGSTPSAVAARAGTARSVPYRRWPNRAGLVLAAMRHRFGSLTDEAMLLPLVAS